MELYTPRKIRQYVSCPKKNCTTTLKICKKCNYHLGVKEGFVLCKYFKKVE